MNLESIGSSFYLSICLHPTQRKEEDVTIIFNHLRKLEVFERLSDAPLRSVCRTARLERHPANYILFRRGHVATCWYILLAGSVFMNKQIYLPIGCFGKRSNMNLRRNSDCICLQPSDVIVIDYPDVQRISVHIDNNPTVNTMRSVQPVTHCNVLPTTSSTCLKTNPTSFPLLNYSERTFFTHSQQTMASSSGSIPKRVPSPAPSSSNQSRPLPIRPSFPVGFKPPPPPVTEWPPGPPPRLPPKRRDHIINQTEAGMQLISHQKSSSMSSGVVAVSMEKSRLSYQQPVTSSFPEENYSHQIPTISYSSNHFKPALNNLRCSNVLQKRTIFEGKRRPQHPVPVSNDNFLTHIKKSQDNIETHKPSNDSITCNGPFIKISTDSMTDSQTLSKESADSITVTSDKKIIDPMTIASPLFKPSIPESCEKNSQSDPHHRNTNGCEFDKLSKLSELDFDESEEDEEESCPSHDSFAELRDSVRECLEKHPAERNSDDLAILMEFMQQMPALAFLPQNIKRELCLKMVFAVVSNAGTVILHNGEKIDAWSVVVNGSVEHIKQSINERVEYHVGDCFGAQGSSSMQHDGELRTLVNDCEFVLVEFEDFVKIMSTLPQHIERESDNLTGEIVKEMERRLITPSHIELVILKASGERLFQHLIQSDQHESHFVEDFLLMHRVFQPDSASIAKRLLEEFKDFGQRNETTGQIRIARIILLWLNNHFVDWEKNREMEKLLDEFEDAMENANMHNQLSLLNITCSAKANLRTITLTRSDRDRELSFNLIAPSQPEFGIFISQVESGSIPDRSGLKRGDEILEVNGQNFKLISLDKAHQLIRQTTHLSMTVRANRLGLKEALFAQGKQGTVVLDKNNDHSTDKNIVANRAIVMAGGRYQKKSSAPLMLASCHQQDQLGIRRSTFDNLSAQNSEKQTNTMVLTKSKTEARKDSSSSNMSSKNTVLAKLMNMILNSNSGQESLAEDFSDETRAASSTLRASRSNPDISSHITNSSNSSNNTNVHRLSLSFPTKSFEHVIKVYRSDQTFRYISIYPDTSVKTITQLALQEFGIQLDSMDLLEWALYDCSVSREGVIKQRRLPDSKTNLIEHIALNSRFYLKNINSSEPLIPDELAPDVLKESRLNLYTLNAQFIAAQLTFHDFAVFSSIESVEYVNKLFGLEDAPNINDFESIFNREMFWVMTELVYERNVYRRAKLLKKFIKIARHCREIHNLNSMFAIISALEKPAIRRLSHTWERVPGKYLKMLSDIQQLMDPSRNMSRYRMHLAQISQDPPVIPIYPIVNKDLMFAHEANPTFCKKLINFEKLRMIAQIIRLTTRLSTVAYDEDQITNQFLELESGGTIRRLGPAYAMPLKGASRKKLYEQALMVRKVKTYLRSMPVIDSEAELDQISLECEPAPLPTAGNNYNSSAIWGASIPGNTAPLARRRMPSPSPSSLSSHSNQSTEQKQRYLPKFGMESPQAVQKMLALVHNSKIKIPHNSRAFSPTITATTQRFVKKSAGNRSTDKQNSKPRFTKDLPPAGKILMNHSVGEAPLEKNERVIL